MTTQSKQPSLGVSLLPVIVLVVLMVINVMIFKDDATGGANQLALLMAATVSGLLGHFVLKTPYENMEQGIKTSIDMAMVSSIILLVIGSVIGIWIISGIVPTLIYYGFKIVTPALFLPVACISCAIISLATGSSWTTTGTMGIALMAIGKTYGLGEGMIAGAIISGAYFGDKMSPLSDTTNLAPAMAGTDLFTHIKHMTLTSGPAMLLALVGFSILSAFNGGADVSLSQIEEVSKILDANFSIGPHMLIVPMVVLIMVGKKVPAIPALIAGTFFGGIFALIFQQDVLLKFTGDNSISGVYKGLMQVLYGGFSLKSGNEMIDSLLSRGGMSGMLSTIWLILCAMIFGGVMEATGMLQRIADSILSLVKGTGSLIGATLASCIFTNATASDQYVAIVVPGRMFRGAYLKYGLKPKNLSRALEDAGTVTSVLIPWNSGGAYNSGVLGVATLTYLPYCFFNILSPIVSGFLAATGWSIERLEQGEQS